MSAIKKNIVYFEGMTSISALIKAYELPTHRNIIKVIYDQSKVKANYSRIKFLKSKSEELGFELQALDREQIDKFADCNTHGGFIAACEQRDYPSLLPSYLKQDGIYFVLEGVEDPFNFGYTVRSLYAAGVDGVILPERNWLDATATVCRSSAGCTELINTYVGDVGRAVQMMKENGYTVACANITDSVSLYSANLSAPIVFIIGGEKRGISRTLLDMADVNVRIDYAANFKGSLPTSAAASLMAFEAAKFNKKFES
jgi:23S rRNA (guanosine2251-2'-O)-methyltransferase